MSIIGNIQNNIVIIYEIKSFYVTLAAGKMSHPEISNFRMWIERIIK
jgi:hypothetical protein